MKKQYIVGIIVVVLIMVGGISYKVYADQQEKQRITLLNETKKNVLKNDDYKYLKDNKLISEKQTKEYDNLIKELGKENLKTKDIETYKTKLNNLYTETFKNIQSKHEKLSKEQKNKIEKIKVKTKDEKETKQKLQKNVTFNLIKQEEENHLKYLSTAIVDYKKSVSLNKDIEKLKKQVEKREAKKNILPNNEQPNYNNNYYNNGNYNNNNGNNYGGNSGGGGYKAPSKPKAPAGGNSGWEDCKGACGNPNYSGDMEF